MTPYIIAIFVVIAFFMYWYSKSMMPKIQESYAKAQEEFSKNESAYLSKYWEDENRFKMFKQVFDPDTIIGMSSCSLIQGTFSKFKESVISSVTNVNKFDMSLYFLVATEQELILLGSSGTEFFLNQKFPFSGIQNVRLKADNSMYTNVPMKLSFDFAGKKQNLECSGMLLGFPKFEVYSSTTQVMLRTQNDRNFNPYRRKFFANTEELGEQGGTLDLLIRQKYNKAFLLKLEEKLNITFPAKYKM